MHKTKFYLNYSEWASRNSDSLRWRNVFFRKSLYITLNKTTPPLSISIAFTAFWSEKKIVELLRPSRTRSLTFSPWKSCPFVFLRRHSLLCGFLSTSCRPIGNIYFFVTDVVAWLRDEKTLELKSDSQLEYRGRAVIPIAHPGEINAVPPCSSNLFWPFVTVAFQIADIRSRSMNQVVWLAEWLLFHARLHFCAYWHGLLSTLFES